MPLTAPPRPAGSTAAAREAQRRYDDLALYVELVREVHGHAPALADVLDTDPTYVDAVTAMTAQAVA